MTIKWKLSTAIIGFTVCFCSPPGVAAAPTLLVVSGASSFVDCQAVPAAIRGTNTETETRLAVDPTSSGQRMVGVWIQDAQLGDVASASSDGGKTWRQTPLPFSRCAPGGASYDRALDPWVSFGPDGRAYASGLALTLDSSGETGAAVVASTSVDGGVTWSASRAVVAVVRESGLNMSIDKPMVLADPSLPGSAFVVWQQYRNDGTAPPSGWFSRTTNGGRTWSKARNIVPSVKGSGASWHQLVASPRSHVVYDIFNLVRPQMTYRTVCKKRSRHPKRCKKVGTPVPGRMDGFIAFVKSKDRGKTWSKPSIVATDLSLGIAAAPGGLLTVGPGIDAAIDPRNGRMYIVWTDARFTQLQFDGVLISSSGDGGKHWTPPHPVSTLATSFNPSVAINAGGTVGVTFYDLRDVGEGTTTIPTDVWFSSSSDGGQSFTGETKLGQFDFSTAPLLQGYFIGDYMGLVSTGASFRSLFIMTTGTPGNATDVYTTSIG